jgi:hypothetical protein
LSNKCFGIGAPEVQLTAFVEEVHRIGWVRGTYLLMPAAAELQWVLSAEPQSVDHLGGNAYSYAANRCTGGLEAEAQSNLMVLKNTDPQGYPRYAVRLNSMATRSNVGSQNQKS